MTDIKGKTILITGAASGLGKLMAHTFGQLGAKLVLWDVNKVALDGVVAALLTKGVTVRGYVVNLSDKSDIARVAAQTLNDVRSIEIIVNNAGIVVGKPLLEASDEEIERTFAVNALALFWVTRAFLPGMIERNAGHIVTVASAAGISGTAKLVDYCSSKFAAVGFDEALRVELRRLNTAIKTTVICPFYIDTGMFEGVKTRFPRLLPILKPEYVVRKIVKAIQRDQARVVMPRLVKVIYPARLLPTALFDSIQRFFGVSATMDDFVGHPACASTPSAQPNNTRTDASPAGTGQATNHSPSATKAPATP